MHLVKVEIFIIIRIQIQLQIVSHNFIILTVSLHDMCTLYHMELIMNNQSDNQTTSICIQSKTSQRGKTRKKQLLGIKPRTAGYDHQLLYH